MNTYVYHGRSVYPCLYASSMIRHEFSSKLLTIATFPSPKTSKLASYLVSSVNLPLSSIGYSTRSLNFMLVKKKLHPGVGGNFHQRLAVFDQLLVSISTNSWSQLRPTCLSFAQRKLMHLSSVIWPFWCQNFDEWYLRWKIDEKRPTIVLVTYSTNGGRNCDLFLIKIWGQIY